MRLAGRFCHLKTRPPGLRGKTRVWKSGRSVAETHTRWAPWLYMTYDGDLVMAALSWWWLVCGI